MMANWEKLNNEYFNLIDSFEDSDWENWESIRASRKEMRRLELILKAKIQEEKLKFSQIMTGAIETFKETVVTTQNSDPFSSTTYTHIDLTESPSSALAA